MKPNEPHNEPALVWAAQKGDKEALQALLTANWGWLKSLAYGVLGRAQDLDDVMQDVCLRVITRIHTLRDPQCLKSWLAIVTKREAIKHSRRKWGITHTDVDSDEVQLVSPGDGPLEDLERKELCGQVIEAVEALPQKYREVFMLAHTGELTYAQMAEVLNVPITTMQIRLVRARRMVQNQIFGKSERKVQQQ